MKSKKLILSLIMFLSCFNQVHGMKLSSSYSTNKDNESTELKLDANSFIQHKRYNPLKPNSKNYISKQKKYETSEINRIAIAEYVKNNLGKFPKVFNSKKYLKNGVTEKSLETKNAYYIKMDDGFEDTLKGLLNAIIRNSEGYPDGKDKEEVLDKYTCKLRDWCLASMKPLCEVDFKKLKEEYLNFDGKNYRNKFRTEAKKKPGTALNECIQGFKYLPASACTIARSNNIKGICNYSIIFDSVTNKYRNNVSQDPRYKNDNIFIESRAVCEDEPSVYEFYENNLAQIRLLVFYKYDNSASRVFLTFDHYNKDGIIFEIQPRLGS